LEFILFDQITQSPLNVFKKTGENAAIRCSHSILDYNRILWYEQSKQKGMTFLTHMVGDSWIPEEGTPVTLTGSAKSNETCTLKTGKLTLESSAVTDWVHCDTGSYPAYFGGGTKLTVLDPNYKVTPPTVKLLGPSSKENGKHRNGKKTLVCVASKFYPDHVSVSWYFNDVLTNGLVASDHSATWLGESYRITSRLIAILIVDIYNCIPVVIMLIIDIHNSIPTSSNVKCRYRQFNSH
uniref:Ig-like domain-containing protein n=1 Tax=Gouania willdenowi TaxID=441366 RepID=A0A8C5DM68_GOUWI